MFQSPKLLILLPILISITLCSAIGARAAETTTNQQETVVGEKGNFSNSNNITILKQVNQYSTNDSGENDTADQVTAVSQLSNVRPTDWAFQALQSLVERYGCIAGYPDGAFKGNRAITRYEFAAGLNACLERVNELVKTSNVNLASKQDLEVLLSF